MTINRFFVFFFFFQAEDGIRDRDVTGVQTCALPISLEIVLEDRGVTANPKKMCGRKLEDVRPGGLGLHFIRESMDTVEFSRRKGRNQLRLVKILHVQEPRKGS